MQNQYLMYTTVTTTQTMTITTNMKMRTSITIMIRTVPIINHLSPYLLFFNRMSYTPQRIQYPFTGLTNEQQLRIVGRNVPLAKKLHIQEQWGAFERIENYNDIIYQKYQQGLRSEMYYQYRTNQELNDYNAGQLMHTLAYPDLPVNTFQSIRDRPLPDVPIVGTLPLETNVPRFTLNRLVPTASEQATFRAEQEVYAYVSTYNASHVLKYTFVDDTEKNAYERVELRLNAIPSNPPPN
jgi:hypothetical protein